jgi:hypothetical protein
VHGFLPPHGARCIILSMSRSIDITDLPQPMVEAIEAIVRTYREQVAGSGSGRRPIGWARDILPELPESFFEPLPPDVLDLFEGKAA